MYIWRMAIRTIDWMGWDDWVLLCYLCVAILFDLYDAK